MGCKRKKKCASAASPPTYIVDFCNIRGLHSNLNAVHQHLESAKPALLFLTETQINPPDDLSYLRYPGYNLEHAFKSRAGVCMYIKGDICYHRLHSLEVSDLSVLWARVDYSSCSRVYACLYRSHSGDAESARLFEHIQWATDRVLEQYPTAELVILGDFNAHHKEWLKSRTTDYAGGSVYDLALAYGFSQIVPEPTRVPDIETHTASLLDLLLTTHPADHQVSVMAPLGSSDHCLVRSTSTLATRIRPQPSGTRQVWHYGSADWDGLREHFASYPWRQLCFATSDPSICADAVTDVIHQGMECFIPYSDVPVGGRNQPWFGRPCAEATNRKQEAFRAWRSAHTNKDPNASTLRKTYNAVSRSTKKRIALAKAEFVGRIGERLMTYPSGSRAFWSLAKAVEGNFCRSTYPPLRKPDGNLAHTAKEKADLLGTFFASNSTLDDRGSTPPTILRCESSMGDILFTQKLVRRALLSLDTKKSSGPDSIPAVVLKMCAPELTPALTRLFRLSYTSGQVPSSWKIARVHPIPKKGDRSDPANYRPIAITSLLSKVMEHIINKQLLGYLEDCRLISDRQYGFRKGRSAGDLLVYLTHRWAQAIEGRGEALAVSLDMAKAFDRVWHKGLLTKLPSYGLPERLCNWTASFLSERYISVTVDGHCSDKLPINAGVPQGSVLSPTLFLLHINDMLAHNASVHCYADDSTVDAYYTAPANASRSLVEEGRARLVSEIEDSLERVSEWGRLNLVQFNPSKTQVCAFTAKKSPFVVAPQFQNVALAINQTISILGVDISNDVQFRGHLEGKAKLASKKLGVLNKAKQYFSATQLATLYKAQVRPHMEYCSHLWAGAPKYQLGPLDSIQKRAIRIINNPKITKKFQHLSQRRDIGSLCVFYRLYHGECSSELFDLMPTSPFHHRTTRRRERFHPHQLDTWRSSTTRFSRSFLPRTCKLWNKLPRDVFLVDYDMGHFKKGVNQSLSLSLKSP